MEKFILKILHTSDIHGKIYPLDNNENNKIGSLCNASTLITNLRDENTILIDTGDIIQGSALTYYHNKNFPNKINPMAKVFNYLKYDSVILGNHEFNYGQKYLQNFIDNLKADVITNNIYKNGELYLKPYKIKTFKNGFKVAIIGSVIDQVPEWEKDYNIEGLTFTNVLEELNKNIKLIKKHEKPDCIIFAYHGGFEINPITNLKNESIRENVGYEILKINKDIDVLLTGHQHKMHVGIENGIVYTQPSSNGSYVGEIKIKYSYENRKWIKDYTEANLIDTYKYEIDNEILKINYKLNKEAEEWLDSKLGVLTTGTISPTTPFNDRFYVNDFFTFMNKVQIYSSGVDISCCSIGNKFIGLNENITPREILNSYKYSNYLVVVEIDGYYLLEALEFNSNFFELKNNTIVINKTYEKPKYEYYNYDVYYGIQYTIDLRKKVGSRITAYYSGEKIESGKKYKVVCNNYRANGGGNFKMFKKGKVIKEIRKEITDLMIEYVYNNKEISLQKSENIKFLF